MKSPSSTLIIVGLVLFCASTAVASDIFQFKVGALTYWGDAYKRQKAVFLNTADEYSEGAVSTAPFVSETLGLDTANFTFAAKMGFTEYEGCMGSAFVFSFGGNIKCMKKGKLDQCSGVSFVYDQDGTYSDTPGCYLLKDGRVVDFTNTTFPTKGVRELVASFKNIGGKWRSVEFTFDGEDIFSAKKSKGYDMAFSIINDVSEELKFMIGGASDGTCAQVHRVASLELEVENLHVDKSTRKMLKKYVKPGSLDSYTTLIALFSDSMQAGPERLWMPFSFGFLIIAVFASVFVVLKSARETSQPGPRGSAQIEAQDTYQSV